MHADIEHVITETPTAASGVWRTDINLVRPLTPPRLRAADAATDTSVARLTIADLRLPTELVRARATHYAALARARGVQHSMRLWRVGYQQALLSLTREAANVASDAPCLAFFWEQQGRDYKVSATFGRAPLPRMH